MDKYDIITFGSASEDLFVFSKKFFDGKLCFPVGEKIEMDEVLTRTGGGGTNAAATFALQGLRTAYCGSVGKDYAGFSILLGLKKFGISTQFLNSLEGKTTNHSVILSKKEKGRAILVYRDASNYLPKNFTLKNLKTDWFYLAPLGGEFAEETKDIINFAHFHKIKLAFNPSKKQIKELKRNIKDWLPKIDVLLMNEIEAEMLFKDYKKPKVFLKEIKPYLKGIFATGSKEDLMIFDGKNIYQAKLARKKITDLTGGGDAFGSGFVAGLIKTNNIEKAVQLASANASACLQKWGAKEGLLKAGQKYQKVEVKVKKIL